jgi:hypothetical protein
MASTGVPKLVRGLVLMTLLLCQPWQPAVADDTLRCGSKIIHTGDGKDKVRTLCGEPTDIAFVGTIERRTIPDSRSYDDQYYYGPAWAELPVEVWTYNFGPSKLLRKLRFVGNDLVSITTDGHGY